MLDASDHREPSFWDHLLRPYLHLDDFLTPMHQRVLHALRVSATDTGKVVGKSWAQLAELAGCDKRTIGRALAALEHGMMAHVEERGSNRRTRSVIWVAMGDPPDACRAESAAALAKPPPYRKRRGKSGANCSGASRPDCSLNAGA